MKVSKASDITMLDSESGVIATLIHHPEYIFESEELIPQHFSDYDNQCVYAAIYCLTSNGVFSVDAYNIIEALNSSEATRKFSENLTVDKLNELIDMSDILSRHTVDEYKILVKNVCDASFRREMYSKLEECKYLCADVTSEDIKSTIYRIIDETISSYSMSNDVPTFAELVDDMWDEIKVRQGEGYAGIPFKFPMLNEYVTIEKGELVIFGAQQKAGKSIMLLNCAVDLLRQGYSVLYIDSELSTRMFTVRLLSHLSGVPFRDLRSGNYGNEEAANIAAAIQWLKGMPFTHKYMPFFDDREIYSVTRQVNHKYPLDVIVIDYFKSTGNETDAYSTYAKMGRCVDLVKNEICGDMNIAGLGAAQATINNRLADSAKIARNASTIVMIMDKTPEEIDRDGVECGNKKLFVPVNRNGMQMAEGEYIDLMFDGNRVSFEQAKQHQISEPY